MKRIAYSIAAALAALPLAWLAGFDFNERGPGALLTAWGSLGACVFVYTWPGWKKR